MQQQRQQEQVEPVDLRQQPGQPLLVFVRGLAQAVYVVNTKKSVLVDGIAVIAVANHQRVDAVELGNQHFKHAQRVHGAQRVRGVRTQQHLAQRIPKVWPFGNMNSQHRQRVGDAVFSSLRQSVAVRCHERKDPQNCRGVVELRSRLHVDAALVEQEISTGNGSSAPPELLVKADWSRQMLHQQRGAAIDDPCVPVIRAHPVAGVGGSARFKADGSRRRLVLRLPVERVVVAPVTEVQKTSGRGQKVEGRLGVAACALEDATPLPRPLFGFLQMEQHREPDGEVIVPQAAGTLLEIGLEVKDGVAVFCVAAAGNFAQLLRNVVPLTQHQAGKRDLVKLLIEGELAGQVSTVKRGQRELKVVAIEFAGFLDRPRAGAGAQTHVPHALDDGSDRFARLLLGLLVGEGKENVDVGIWEEIFAPVAAQSQQRDALRRQVNKRPAPHFNEDTVDYRRAPPDGRGTVASTLTGLADKRHLFEILLP